MTIKPIKTLLCASVLAAFGASANAAQWDITITNLTHGNHFTPVLMTGMNSGAHLFEVGSMATPALELMAECGDTTQLTGISGVAGELDEDTKTGTDPINPGASTMLSLDTAVSGNTHLSIVSMILPTTDAFVGLDALEVPIAAGSYTYYLNAYDAGTEANNETIATAPCGPNVPGFPIAPADDAGTNGTGAAGDDSNTTVHIHRGVLGDQDATGGISDLNSSIHRWQNPVAKIVITVTP